MAQEPCVGRRRFELLSCACVEAHSSSRYQLTTEDVEWRTDRVAVAQKIVGPLCGEGLDRTGKS